MKATQAKETKMADDACGYCGESDWAIAVGFDAGGRPYQTTARKAESHLCDDCADAAGVK